MCDWEAEEFAEYLRWVEAALAPPRVTAQASRPRENVRRESPLAVPPRIAAEA